MTPRRLFERLLTDYDPRIADRRAAAALRDADRVAAAQAGASAATTSAAAERTGARGTGRRSLVARVELDSGGSFDIAFDPRVRDAGVRRDSRVWCGRKYFDGLTFHRVAPNFVVQGGSPGQTSTRGTTGSCADELGDRRHATGTVGLSTSGRDTGRRAVLHQSRREPDARVRVHRLWTGRRTRGWSRSRERSWKARRSGRIRMVPPMR